jgi:hypothetical protein
MNAEARFRAQPNPDGQPRSSTAMRALLAMAAILAGLWLVNYWEMVLHSDGGGFHDAMTSVISSLVSFVLVLFVMAVGSANECRRRDTMVRIACLLLVAGFFLAMKIESHFASGIRQIELDANRAKAIEVVDELNRFVKRTGEAPKSLADAGIADPVVYTLSGFDRELRYERVGPNAFQVSYSEGWYSKIYSSWTDTWESRD